MFVKKITAILLLFCLVFASAGYHLVFRYQISHAKAQMKRALRNSSRNSEDVTEFSFTNENLKQLEWEDDHEFRFKGKMYDVIEKQWQDGKLHIRCISDEKETVLIDQYMQINKNNHSDSKPLSSLIQLITAQFIQPFALIPELCAIQIKNSFPFYSSRLFSTAFPIHTPPPRC